MRPRGRRNETCFRHSFHTLDIECAAMRQARAQIARA
jgi:hypothetical protein